MDKFTRICLSIGLLGALICFIIIGYFLSNSNMTIGELFFTAFSTMDAFNKVGIVIMIVAGIIITLQNHMVSRRRSKWEDELSDEEVFLLEKFRQKKPITRVGIINILKDPSL